MYGLAFSSLSCPSLVPLLVLCEIPTYNKQKSTQKQSSLGKPKKHRENQTKTTSLQDVWQEEFQKPKNIWKTNKKQKTNSSHVWLTGQSARHGLKTVLFFVFCFFGFPNTFLVVLVLPMFLCFLDFFVFVVFQTLF